MIHAVSEFLTDATSLLLEAGISTARLDCIVLLEDELQKDRAWILAHPEHDIPTSSLERLSKQLSRRTAHVPLAYIRGKTEFYGREFEVTNHTLVPRPETETMIECLKSLSLPEQTRLVDVGTGSGCIAISAALELPGLEVLACDIDLECLAVAERNAHKLEAKVTFMQSNLIERVNDCDVIGANLPYVPNDYSINTAATHEPSHAIFGGTNGLDLYKQLFRQITQMESDPRYVLTESLPFQHRELAGIAKAASYTMSNSDDFIQLFELD
jgi:release factor glutamine methyltransferase